MHIWHSLPALFRECSSNCIYIGDIECGDVVPLGIYSFNKSLNRRISLPAAAKSP